MFTTILCICSFDCIFDLFLLLLLFKLKFLTMHEIVFLVEKLPSDFTSVSSLVSYNSDQPLKSANDPSLLKPTSSNHYRSSYEADTVNARDVSARVPALLPCDSSRFSPKLKADFLGNDSSMASNPACSELSCTMDTGIRHTCSEILQSPSSSSSSISQPDKSAGAQGTSEMAAAISDCAIIVSLKDCVKAPNCVPENPVTSSDSGIDAELQNSLSLSANDASDAVKNCGRAVNSGLRVSINSNSALDSNGTTATVLSPSEDFRSIYASNDHPLATSPVTGETFISESETTHSYPDSDSIDAWLEFPRPGKSAVLSLCVSRRTAWYVDKAERLYCSSLKGPGLSWNTVDQPAQQISCSPSGFIIWRVYSGSAFSAVGRISGKSAAGIEWREVARDVAYVSADNNVVW